MSEKPTKPDLTHQFGTRVGTALRPNPARGPDGWTAYIFWETPEWWVVCTLDGKGEYDWDYAQDCLGEEEESGRFASFAREYLPRATLDAAGFRARFDREFSAPGCKIGWWQRWNAG